MDERCVFCQIVKGESPAEVMHEGKASMIIRPLNPVTEGHLLVIPKYHVTDAAANPVVAGKIMDIAAGWVRWQNQGGNTLYDSVNFITSVGEAATQTVFHLHIHVVPRAEGDGLHLPWTGQH